MEIKEVALITLKPYPNNPRKGNIDLIAKSLETYGQYKPITINKRTNEILAGNHTFQAAKKLGWATIQATYIDVDANTAAKIVLMDNKTSDSGGYDDTKLLGLLDSLGDLSATGYTDKDLKELQSLYDSPATDLRNTVMGKSLKDWQETLGQRSTRIIMFDFEKPRYTWVAERLEQFRNENDLATNTDALIRLIEKISGEGAPE
jgi:hypothetical protein